MKLFLSGKKTKPESLSALATDASEPAAAVNK